LNCKKKKKKQVQTKCFGTCFHQDSTMKVVDPTTRTTKTVPLHSLAVGDRVLSVNHASRKEQFSKVVALPHSASHEAFVEVTVSDKKEGKKEEEAASTVHRSLLATEHHTFPLCDTGFRKEVSAMDLKHGQCLLTEGGGKGVVTGLKRVAPQEGSQTYTVVLEGASDLAMVGGIVTHARPSKPASPSASASAAVKGKTQKKALLASALHSAEASIKNAVDVGMAGKLAEELASK
jgi:hypothetical protein